MFHVKKFDLWACAAIRMRPWPQIRPISAFGMTITFAVIGPFIPIAVIGPCSGHVWSTQVLIAQF